MKEQNGIEINTPKPSLMGWVNTGPFLCAVVLAIAKFAGVISIPWWVIGAISIASWVLVLVSVVMILAVLMFSFMIKIASLPIVVIETKKEG